MADQDLLDRIFAGTPWLRDRFDTNALTEADIRLLMQRAYLIGIADQMKNQTDYWKRPKTEGEN